MSIQWNWKMSPPASFWDSLLIRVAVLFPIIAQCLGRSEIMPRQEALDFDSQASSLAVIWFPAIRTQNLTVHPELALWLSCTKPKAFNPPTVNMPCAHWQNIWPQCLRVWVTLCSKEFWFIGISWESRGQRFPCHFLCQRSWMTCGKDINQGRLIYVPAFVWNCWTSCYLSVFSCDPSLRFTSVTALGDSCLH